MKDLQGCGSEAEASNLYRVVALFLEMIGAKPKISQPQITLNDGWTSEFLKYLIYEFTILYFDNLIPEIIKSHFVLSRF